MDEPELLDLMIKNVSRDETLTKDEVQVLKDFKSALVSKDEWKECLRYARSEKKLRVLSAELEGSTNLENLTEKVNYTYTEMKPKPKKNKEDLLYRTPPMKTKRITKRSVGSSSKGKNESNGDDGNISDDVVEEVITEYIDDQGHRHRRHHRSHHHTHRHRTSNSPLSNSSILDANDNSDSSLIHENKTPDKIISHQTSIDSAIEFTPILHAHDQTDHSLSYSDDEDGNLNRDKLELLVSVEKSIDEINEKSALGVKKEEKTEDYNYDELKSNDSSQSPNKLNRIVQGLQDLTRSNKLRIESAVGASKFLVSAISEGSELSSSNSLIQLDWPNLLSALTLIVTSLEKSQQIGHELDLKLNEAMTELNVDTQKMRKNSNWETYINDARGRSTSKNRNKSNLGQAFRPRSASPAIVRRVPSFGTSTERISYPTPNGHGIIPHQTWDSDVIRINDINSSSKCNQGKVLLGRCNNILNPDSRISRVCVELDYARLHSKANPRKRVPRRENPIYLNSENNSIEVVWRQGIAVTEKDNCMNTIDPLTGNASTNSDIHGGAVAGHGRIGIPLHNSNDRKQLRRENFFFDDVYTCGDDSKISETLGNETSMTKLYNHISQRAKTCLSLNTNLVVVSLACGDTNANEHIQCLEPPLSLLLGEQGNSGLVQKVLQEVFDYSPEDENLHYKGDNSVSYSSAEFIAGSLSFNKSSGFNIDANYSAKQQKNKIAYTPEIQLSAVLVVDGLLSDLLTASMDVMKKTKDMNSSKKDKTNPYIGINNLGDAIIHNTATVNIKSLADYERLVGVLLGRRAALQEILPSLLDENKTQMGTNLNTASDSALIAWLLGEQASLLLTLNVNNDKNSSKYCKNSRNIKFHFACPYGGDWSQPSSDINLLLESLSWPKHSLDPPMNLFIGNPMAQFILNMPLKSVSTNQSDRNRNRKKREDELSRTDYLLKNRKHINTPEVSLIVGLSNASSYEPISQNQTQQEKDVNKQRITTSALASLRLTAFT